jgi:ribonuclease D
MSELQFIDTAPALAALVAELNTAPALAVDTEFMREETYYPRLCLIQIGTPTAAYGIDPLALEDLSSLCTLLEKPDIRIVLHAARQDIEVLLTRCAERPNNLFDTQVAAALCGLPPQIGYGDLVDKMLGVHLEKGHSRTDWTRRPLNPEQLHYAAEDVHYLLPLQEEMRRRLEQLDRLPWFEAEMQRLEDPALYRTLPDQAWQRLKGLDPDDQRRFATAKALAEWRERRAMDRNRPRGWILSDDALHQIVRALPEDMPALSRLNLIPPGTVQRNGADLLAAVASTAHLPANPLQTQRYTRPNPEEQRRLKELTATVKKIAEDLKVSPEILATRRDLQALMSGKTDIAPLQGWRRQVLGEALLKS